MKPKAKRGKTTIYTRKTGEDLRRVTLYFPVELHQRARIAAIMADIPLSEFVMDVLEEAL